MKYRQQKQNGFTLIEIAIVLVIIGLLLGGVLKGQEMIENSRIKSIVTDMRGISTAFTGYYDRYRALPGDETAATVAARGWGALGGGNANGALTIAVGDTFVNANAEHAAMWQHLRAAGFLSGDPLTVGVAGLPRSAVGTLIGATITPYAMPGPAICVAGLSHKQAAGVDVIVDGTLPATNIGNNVGEIRGAANAVNPFAPAAVLPAGAAYNEAAVTTWTLCRRMQ
ncbi:MAG: prepilin-type N-terminal cleavage/methylation domain-containing protein [Burkholderiales bacterium]|nr:prepilin-type N-terminal cleavage/methylation domain-containing protein [Burkholderiales bacterium]